MAGASGDASLVSAPVKAQFNKLNCADKNWKQQVGYRQHTSPQYNNKDIQTVSCGWEGGVLYKFVLDQAKVTGQGHQVGQCHRVRRPRWTGRPT